MCTIYSRGNLTNQVVLNPLLYQTFSVQVQTRLHMFSYINCRDDINSYNNLFKKIELHEQIYLTSFWISLFNILMHCCRHKFSILSLSSVCLVYSAEFMISVSGFRFFEVVIQHCPCLYKCIRSAFLAKTARPVIFYVKVRGLR